MACSGTTAFQFIQGQWLQQGDSGCAGECPRGTCQPLSPAEILGDAELEKDHADILDTLKTPYEGMVLQTRCTCR